MTDNKHDFEGALNWFVNLIKIVPLPLGGNFNVLRDTHFALRLAARLQSGEVSPNMYDAHCKMLKSSDPNWIKIQYQAMTTQLMKEVEDDKV